MVRDEDSSSSESRRRSRRIQYGRIGKIKYSGSSCGIRTLNECQDKFVKLEGKRTSKAKKESKGSRAKAEAKATDHGNGHFSSSASASAAALRKGSHALLDNTATANAEFGLGGAIAGAEASVAGYNLKEDGANLDVGKAFVGGEVGIGAGGAKAMIEAGVDAVSAGVEFGKGQEVSTALGYNANTGAEVGVDGVSASVLGVGFSVGRNMGINLPFGRVNFKLW